MAKATAWNRKSLEIRVGYSFLAQEADMHFRLRTLSRGDKKAVSLYCRPLCVGNVFVSWIFCSTIFIQYYGMPRPVLKPVDLQNVPVGNVIRDQE